MKKVHRLKTKRKVTAKKLAFQKLQHKIIFFSGFFILACMSISMIGIFAGDQFLAKEQTKAALKAYEVSKLLNPFLPNVDKRLLAAAVVDKERNTHSEETDEDDFKGNAISTNVLGASVTVPVLMYHYIRINPNPNDKVGFNLSVTPYNFDKQMKYFKDAGYTTIGLDRLLNAINGGEKLPPKPIIITFDDGYKDCYKEAFPILKKHGFIASNFIITGVVGTPRYLSWDEIKEMNSSGVFTFGSHTVRHSALTYLADSQVLWELSESKKDLEAHLPYSVAWFAYPYGNVNERVAKLVKKAGFSLAFGTNAGAFHSLDALYTLPRVRVGGGDSPQSLAARLP